MCNFFFAFALRFQSFYAMFFNLSLYIVGVCMRSRFYFVSLFLYFHCKNPWRFHEMNANPMFFLNNNKICDAQAGARYSFSLSISLAFFFGPTWA